MSGWGSAATGMKGSNPIGGFQQPPQVVQMLREAKIYPPQQEQRIVDEVTSALRRFQALVPQLAFYERPNGGSIKLLRLEGTIAISYMGGTYNIPVSIWITEYHPNCAPLAYVNPVEGMMIPPGHKHVAPDGRVYHPYLYGWSAQTHSTVGLLMELVAEFSRRPPLFAKPKNREDDQRKLLLARVQDSVKLRLEQEYTPARREFDSLKQEKTRLAEISKELLDDLSNLNLENLSTAQKVEALKADKSALDHWIADNKEPKQVDDVIKANSVPEQQLLDCVALNRAYQDVLDFLDEGVDRDSIQASQYMREIERVGRLLFFERAHQRKIKLYIAENERSN